jgi:signal transduction histidine kinase
MPSGVDGSKFRKRKILWMKTETFQRAIASKTVFGLFALVILFVMAEAIYGQWMAPVPEFNFNPAGSSIISEVIPGSSAQLAGLQTGDALLKIDNVPFDWSSLATFGNRYPAGKSIQVTVSRNGQLLELNVPLVSAGRLFLGQIIFFSLVVLVVGMISFIFLWRFIQKPEAGMLYLMAQAAGIGFLLPAMQVSDWVTLPPWQLATGGAAASLAVLLSFYLGMTFPVKVGSPVRRRIGMGILCALGLAMAVLWLLNANGLGSLFNDFVITGLLVLIFVATCLLILHAYRRLASHLQRRQLRLVILGMLLSVGPTIFLYSLPKIFFSNAFIPEWLAGICLLTGFITCVYVTLKQNLARIDQLLNRTVVYLLLFTVTLIILVIPVLILDRLLPNDWIFHSFILAGLTLLVAFSYAHIRQWIEQRVDIFFYGGWYDYPKVIDTVSAALAQSLTWEQLNEILTRQVPELMRLTGAWLIVGNEGSGAGLPAAQPQIQIPLQFEGQPYGTWVIGPRRDSDYFSASDRNILATLAPQIEVALSNILHVEKLREQLNEIRASQKTMMKMGQQLIRSRDEEQERLSRELHDGPLQVLVGMNLQLGLLLSKTAPEQAASPSGEALSGLQREVRSLMTELREMVTGLRPPMLDTLGLSSALRALVDNWAAEEHIPVQLDLPLDASLNFLTGEVPLNLYRVVQEALSNIARHAAAHQVRICLACDPQLEGLTLTIQDDGKGFVPEEVYQQVGQNHFGLAGMQERIKLIGGSWTLSSSPGWGTTIQVTWKQEDWQNSGEYNSSGIASDAG